MALRALPPNKMLQIFEIYRQENEGRQGLQQPKILECSGKEPQTRIAATADTQAPTPAARRGLDDDENLGEIPREVQSPFRRTASVERFGPIN